MVVFGQYGAESRNLEKKYKESAFSKARKQKKRQRFAKMSSHLNQGKQISYIEIRNYFITTGEFPFLTSDCTVLSKASARQDQQQCDTAFHRELNLILHRIGENSPGSISCYLAYASLLINKVHGVLEKNDMIFCIARLNQYFFQYSRAGVKKKPFAVTQVTAVYCANQTQMQLVYLPPKCYFFGSTLPS